MTILCWARSEDRTIQEAIGLAAARVGSPAVALAYTPRRCAVARFAGGELELPGGAFDTAEVFELRVFGPDAEVRWLNQDGGRGAMVVLAETAAALDGLADMQSRECMATLPTQYLVWGTPAGSPAAGWTTLAEARIGAIDVPLAGLAGQARARVVGVEYLAVAAEHGNVAVIEERLTGIEGGRRG